MDGVQVVRLSAIFKTAAGRDDDGEPARGARLTGRAGQVELRASNAAPWFSPCSSVPFERIAAISSAGVIS